MGTGREGKKEGGRETDLRQDLGEAVVHGIVHGHQSKVECLMTIYIHIDIHVQRAKDSQSYACKKRMSPSIHSSSSSSSRRRSSSSTSTYQ